MTPSTERETAYSLKTTPLVIAPGRGSQPPPPTARRRRVLERSGRLQISGLQSRRRRRGRSNSPAHLEASRPGFPFLHERRFTRSTTGSVCVGASLVPQSLPPANFFFVRFSPISVSICVSNWPREMNLAISTVEFGG
jgi:hypothetical protein